ncbi:CP4-6 prophage protein [Escherichia coli]|uniref:CP4-6 prophage protein n=1 Tax=Escherichia coli TaxID=562 RepID=A0A377E2J7_ECOLX|nr:CP4-6 prophage protein [Escherichia coli]
MISRMRESLRAKLEADRTRKVREDKRIYRCPLFIIWAKEYSESGKCHYHICLLFNKELTTTSGITIRTITLEG